MRSGKASGSGDASSNNTYLGHVTVVDTTGHRARTRAEELVTGLDVRYADDLAGAGA